VTQRKALVPFERRPQSQPEDDVDFAVSIKVRNGRLLGAIRRAGYRSLAAMCKQHGLPQWPVNDFARMTRSPLNAAGRPSPLAQLVADILKTQVEDLFPPRFMAECLSRAARTEVPMTEDQIGMLIREPPRTPEDVLALDEAAQGISDTLILLPPREERLLRLRYGMGPRDEKTLDQVGDQYGVTRERIRQMEKRAIRKLTGPSRKHRLVEPAVTLGVGHFRVIVPASRFNPRDAGIRAFTDAEIAGERERAAHAARHEQERVERLAARAKLPPPDLPLRPLARPVKFPTIPPVRDNAPDYVRLLRIPAPKRSTEQKLALAYHLEAEFIQRGASRLQPAPGASADYLATLGHQAFQLAKYEWLVNHLPELWARFPPAPEV
jgi:RNA polymerase sigma factor (sigma-70 family)